MSRSRNARRLEDSLRELSRNPLGYLRDAARLPVARAAEARIAALPAVELAELTGGIDEVVVKIGRQASRHAWSLGAAEQLSLQVLLSARRCQTAFEIGTFNGGTTRLLAESLPADGRVWTLDLPPTDFDTTQSPNEFTGGDVGVAYRDSPAAHKITQLFGDSLVFDFAPYEASADLVLVDAGHEYENGLADTRAALRLVRPGGIVLWDDFDAYWDGLVRGICDAMKGRRLTKLAGSPLAVYVADE